MGCEECKVGATRWGSHDSISLLQAHEVPPVPLPPMRLISHGCLCGKL